ncbi:hypothetical protein BDY19DRAFT_447860 [Irpex rosettiformis]|uniref:Uncharacterized protein n=1 Tax=Irpex rosettiformis TaxID=378272 RepID=A0ACB8TTZ8_9APHY|nr:hypothetical protein BDY19DRAFT_447860 [Irpex rosettiformis]
MTRPCFTYSFIEAGGNGIQRTESFLSLSQSPARVLLGYQSTSIIFFLFLLGQRLHFFPIRISKIPPIFRQFDIHKSRKIILGPSSSAVLLLPPPPPPLPPPCSWLFTHTISRSVNCLVASGRVIPLPLLPPSHPHTLHKAHDKPVQHTHTHTPDAWCLSFSPSSYL